MCLDQDETAIRVSTERLAKFGEKVHIVKSNDVHMKEVLKDLHVEKVDGILLDLGVSSYQLDTAEERIFLYGRRTPGYRGMDRQQSISAMEIVNEYPQEELYRVSSKNMVKRGMPEILPKTYVWQEKESKLRQPLN